LYFNAKWQNSILVQVLQVFVILFYFILLQMGEVWLGSVCWHLCATPGNEAEHSIRGGCAKTPVLF